MQSGYLASRSNRRGDRSVVRRSAIARVAPRRAGTSSGRGRAGSPGARGPDRPPGQPELRRRGDLDCAGGAHGPVPAKARYLEPLSNSRSWADLRAYSSKAPLLSKAALSDNHRQGPACSRLHAGAAALSDRIQGRGVTTRRAHARRCRGACRAARSSTPGGRSAGRPPSPRLSSAWLRCGRGP
jgi:hypothetical protein